jgi:2-polyprenyl-6-methoxyphenol hydroxylase-like FAD-dependent oxidoreductase
VLVERRSDPGRRVGHAPPVVAETEAADVEEALDALSELADNNVEVARALQRWQARRSGEAAAAAEQADGGRTEPKSESGPGKNPVERIRGASSAGP